VNEVPPQASPSGPLADASMHDMLRIMDVASTLRRERENAEAQLDAETAKLRLRERLLATAAAAGEAVTPAEVDAAIARYFATQHVYEDPPKGWGSFWAHVWVTRASWLTLLVVFALVTWLCSWLVETVQDAPRHGAPPPPPAATAPAATSPSVASPGATALESAWVEFEKVQATAAAIAADDDAKSRVQGIGATGKLAHDTADLTGLRIARQTLDDLLQRLREEFTVRIVDRPGERSGIDRYQGGKLSGYYLIVEARTTDGRTLARTITNAETGRTAKVSKWGERVDETVWRRIGGDKQSDGILDETLFAKKERGVHDEVVVLDGGTGKPLRRTRQITEW
jgi:hypothetical protein